MTYLGDPYKDFGDFARKEYSNESTGAPVQGNDVSKLAERNSKVKPAGLQGYEGPALSHLAERNSKVKPAGLQGYEGPALSHLAERNSKVKPAGLQGYESYSPLSDFEGSAQEMSQSQLSRMAQNNMKSAPAGSSQLGSLGDDGDAFEGYGEGPSLDTIKAAQRNMHQKPAGFGNLGDDMESWVTYFNQASNAHTDTEILSYLRKAVASVPDNTPEDVKKNYYNLAMQMLQRRKKENLRYMDIKRIELDSNLGWLINPTLVPKTGGFGKAVGKAIAAVGSVAAKNTKTHYDMKQLMAEGDQLKSTLRKEDRLFGDTSEGFFSSKMFVFLLLGAGAAAAFWYYRKRKKAKAVTAVAAKRRKAK